MAQERVQKQKSARSEQDETRVKATSQTNAELAEATDETLANIDDVLEEQADEELLAEIDDVLEENAEQFVASFVQQGGE